jgi:hypothetical protein
VIGRTGTVASCSTAIVIVLAFCANGCTRKNPEYCDTQMDCADGLYCHQEIHTCSAEPLLDASTGCSVNDECLDPQTPICESATCRPCQLDDECSSGVCRADGGCEPTDSVIYVATDGVAAGSCSETSRCELSYAITRLSSSRTALRLANGTYSLAAAIVFGAALNATIVGGRGAVFVRSTTGPSFRVEGGGALTLRGVTVTRGIECGAFGKLNI